MQISDVSASRRQPTSWARRVGDGDEVVNKWGAIVRRVLIRCQETVEFDKLGVVYVMLEPSRSHLIVF